MCPPHWFGLRAVIRAAIWREYRPDQEDDKRPSPRYMAVQQLAIGELVFKPHDEAAALLAAPYLQAAQMWRQRAIDREDGDPLERLVKES